MQEVIVKREATGTSVVVIIFLLSMLTFLGSFTSVTALPVGFIDEGVVSRDAIITGAFTANPRNNNKPMLLLSSKSGQIYAVEDPDNSDKDIQIGDFDAQICTNGERGLQSVTPHPNFKENRFIYLFYSKLVEGCPESEATGPPNRVSRFLVDPDTLMIDPASEVLILQTSPSPKKIHNGGTMAFGVDGYLYITTGDAGMREPSYSQDLSNLFGKILRVDENGDAPPSNPFTTSSGGTGVPCGKNGTGRPPAGSASDAVCEEIYAYGLRNPFRLTMNYTSDERVLYAIGDVGASTWEEISIGGDEYKGVNYGWPIYEGPCIKGSTIDCLDGEKSFVEPYHYYLHTELEEGGCVVGSAFVPTGIGWPEKYKFLFIDFIFDTVYNLIELPNNECRDCKPPKPGYINETFYERDIMIDMFFGPYKTTQALYIISRGSGQSIRRIRYTGTSNVPPVANLTVSDDSVDINDVILFDGSGSSDQDGDDINFLWDFGDGVNSTQPFSQHAYSTYGQYTVTLTVTDSLGQTNQAFTVITVGIQPLVNMISPKLGSRFAVGQEILVLGNATDAFGVALNDSQISWEVRQHHAQHSHPFLDRQAGVGNGFKLDPAPSPEDFTAANNSFLEIIMYATDSFGLVTNISREVYPKKVFITIDSKPRGMEVLVDEFPVKTPRNVTSWENHKLRLNVLDQDDMIFESWSIGGGRKTNYTVPARQLNNPIILVEFTNNVSSPIYSLFPPSIFTTNPPATSQPIAITRSPTLKPIVVTKPPTRKPILVTKPPTRKPIAITKTPIVEPTIDMNSPQVTTSSPKISGTSDNTIDLSNTSNVVSFRKHICYMYLLVVLTTTYICKILL